MKYTSKPDAVLLLEDGTFIKGKLIGKPGTTSGELCFNTGMTGYQEVFTDPSYFGQILIETNVHIGNYGIHPEEKESDSIKIAGLVCKNFNVKHSRKSANDSIDSYFIKNNITGISDLDTRALVLHIRSKGSMNAIISSEITDKNELMKQLKKVPSMKGLELCSKVSATKISDFGNTSAKFRVALLDLGVKENIIRCLVERDCFVRSFPMDSSLDEMILWEPDGFMISNGPGDPGALHSTVEKIKKIMQKNYPMFGICLGQQVIAEACGISTYKMHNGHRGINHPVKNLITGKSEITSQNHGFSINEEEVKKSEYLEITHINLNDGTIEGIRLKNKPVFSVQYHPESAAGPHDSRYLFDEFIGLMKAFVNSSRLQVPG